MAKTAYIGIPTAFPVYKEETKTIAITAANVAQYFTVTNGSYYFAGSGNVFTSNNGGVNSSEATTTLTAKVDISALTFRYSYSSEQKYDKFTLTVGGTTVESAVSGATTTKSYSGSLKAGQSIVLTYAKDSSQSNNDDKCTISNISITIKVKTQTGTETKVVARKVKRQHMGVSGVARKVSKGFAGVNGVARQFFAKIPTWKRYKTNVAYTLGVEETVLEKMEKFTTLHIFRDQGYEPYKGYFTSTSKPDAKGIISIDESAGKVKWTNTFNAEMNWRSGQSDYCSVSKTVDREDEVYPVWFIVHNSSFTHGTRYYGKDEDVEGYEISFTYGVISPDTWLDEVYVTVVYYGSPRTAIYRYYPAPSYSRGDYIGEVTSESEGAYPANGRHTDGYWYVRQ